MFQNIIINQASILTGCNHPLKAPDLLIRCLAKSLFTTSRLIAEDQLLVNRDATFLLWLIKCHFLGPRALTCLGLRFCGSRTQVPFCLSIFLAHFSLPVFHAGLSVTTWSHPGASQLLLRQQSHCLGTQLHPKSPRQMARS